MPDAPPPEMLKKMRLPGNDQDSFAEEDEEGRFFGGGLTSEQKEILNIFDNAGAEQAPDDVCIHSLSNMRCHTYTWSLTSISLKCSLPRVLKRCCYGWREPLTRIRLNGRNTLTIRRSGWRWFPYLVLTITAARFIDSEADLDTAIKALLPLAQVPKVAYPLLVGSGQLEAMVGLLSHENADIALDVIELIHELTDEDVAEEDEDEDEDPDQREAALKSLISALVRLAFIETTGKCAYIP